MRTVAILMLLVVCGAVPASAGLAGKCRKACKPVVADCRALAASGKAKRACKKTIVGGCKRAGVESCASITTTTVPPGGGPTTTTLPSGGGVMFIDVLDVQVAGDADPRTFALQIGIEYGVVTADAMTQVALDPSTFSVVDGTTDTAYPAEPATGPGDCSSADVVAKDAAPVTCTLRFVMPLGAAEDATLEFLSGGLHGSESWAPS
jgi:hypothetical protein